YLEDDEALNYQFPAIQNDGQYVIIRREVELPHYIAESPGFHTFPIVMGLSETFGASARIEPIGSVEIRIEENMITPVRFEFIDVEWIHDQRTDQSYATYDLFLPACEPIPFVRDPSNYNYLEQSQIPLLQDLSSIDIESIYALLSDKDWGVRWMGVDALEVMGSSTEKSVDLLNDVAQNDPVKKVRKKANKALKILNPL
ncbi:MAG: HEAT repeat domain-containing protein, partial [Candidatus Neomarinimicrobiota bacterium]